MTVEVECSSCGGRMMADTPGIVVECPHCQTHLHIPDHDGTAEATDAPVDQTASSSIIGLPRTAPTATSSDLADVADSIFPGLPGTNDINKDANTETDGAATSVTDAFDFGESPPEDNLDVTEAISITSLPDGIAAGQKEDNSSSHTASTPAEPSVERPVERPVEPTRAVVTSAAGGRSPRVSNTLFIVVAGYAVAVTIAVVYLLIQNQSGGRLNLPDVVPKQTGDGKVVFRLFRENIQLPKGHILQLGETQRFGSLEITVVKVTREPAILVGEFDQGPTEDVFKLWLEIKNVSVDQTFAPFGRTLARKRSEKDQRANIFVSRVDQKRRDGERVLMYDLPVADATLVLKGQEIDHPLSPGDEYQTFLASSDVGLESLTGDLVWRVHIRKGYNRKSMRGVTTLFEVNFHRDDVEVKKQAG